MRQVKISKKLMNDVLSVAGGLYSMNATYADCYCFFKGSNGLISLGSFENKRDFIDGTCFYDFDYMFDFSDRLVYKK